MTTWVPGDALPGVQSWDDWTSHLPMFELRPHKYGATQWWWADGAEPGPWSWLGVK